MGALTPITGCKDIPFDIKRVYYIWDVEQNQRRGFHSHRKLDQVLIALGGSVKILVKTPDSEQVISNNSSIKWLVWDVVGSTVYIVPNTKDASLELKGAKGYVNGAALVDDICKTLYINPYLGVTTDKVRSLNISDVESKITYDKTTYENDQGFAYNTTLDNLSAGTHYSPVAVGSTLLSSLTPLEYPVTVTQTSFAVNDSAIGWKTIVGSANTTVSTYADIVKYDAWLASPCININGNAGNQIKYNLFSAVNSSVYGINLYSSNGSSNARNKGLRPLVTLGSNVTINPVEGKDGSEANKAWEIKLKD